MWQPSMGLKIQMDGQRAQTGGGAKQEPDLLRPSKPEVTEREKPRMTLYQKPMGGMMGPSNGKGILQKVLVGHFGHAEFGTLQVTCLVLSSGQRNISRALECKGMVSAGGTDLGSCQHNRANRNHETIQGW